MACLRGVQRPMPARNDEDAGVSKRVSGEGGFV